MMAAEGKKSIERLVDEIIADGKITMAEKLRFEQTMLADGNIDEGERQQIRRIMDLLASGELKVAD